MAKTQAQIDSFVAEVLSAPAHVAQGLKAVSVSSSEAVLEFVAGPAALAPTGAVHGGVLAMLMEPAAVCAVYPTRAPSSRRAPSRRNPHRWRSLRRSWRH